MTDKYDFLHNYIGKIVILRGTQTLSEAVNMPKWKEKRSQFLYKGKITDQNLREILPEEVIIEFDKVAEVEDSVARQESEKYMDQVKNYCISQNYNFKITDHKGISPHLRIIFNGLQYHDFQYIREYKLRTLQIISNNIDFQSNIIEFDYSLINTEHKLISLEHQPHWKQKYGGAIEEVVYEKSDGIIPEIDVDEMQLIQQDFNANKNADDKEIPIGDSHIADIKVDTLGELWKRHYVRGKRNRLILTLGGMCRRRNISFDDACILLKRLLDYSGNSNHYSKTKNELSYSFQKDRDNISVLHHLKNVFPESEAIQVYAELQKCFSKEIDNVYVPLRFDELNAGWIGKHVSLDCQIIGEYSQKAIPILIIYTCDCGEVSTYNFIHTPEIIIFSNQKKQVLKCFHCKAIIKPSPNRINITYTDHSVLIIRDLLNNEQVVEQQNYSQKTVYLIDKELPKSKLVRLKGRVVIEPKTKNISIIADSIDPLKNNIESFKVTDKFISDEKEYFNCGIDLADEINPDIVGDKRKIAKQAIIYCIHSPSRIYDINRKKIIRGTINVSNFGDSKLAKSQIAKDLSNKGYYELGEYCIAETGGRTGFLYAIDNDKGIIIWGALVLNDLGLIILDGLQKMLSEEISEFREAIESQEVIVMRSVKGGATARTRIIACFNPNKPMNEYMFKCEALKDTSIFRSTPDVTRWDLFIPFCQNDVSSREIAQRKSHDRKIPKEIFNNHIYWVWSRKPDDIIYTPEAVSNIKECSEQLINRYSLELLPIVHNGVRDVVTRLSVAQACICNSTDDTHQKIIVQEEHVISAVKFYEDTLSELELEEYKKEMVDEKNIPTNLTLITKDLHADDYNILNEIRKGAKSSTQLSVIIHKSDRTVKEHYDCLKKHGLIETKQGQGIGLSVKGIKFLKALSGGEIVKKNITNVNGEVNLHEFTTNLEESINVTEETIGECSDSYAIQNKDDIISLLLSTRETTYEHLRDHLHTSKDNSWLDKTLAVMKTQGEIFEVRVGIFKLLN